jgi:hypothetical protein
MSALEMLRSRRSTEEEEEQERLKKVSLSKKSIVD